MAVMTGKKPANVVPPVDPVPGKKEEPYKGVTVDTSERDISGMMTYLEGSSWIVDYYAQLIGANDATNSYQPGLNEVYQQYKLVRGMEFKVTSPLSTTQDNETKEMHLTGAANFYGIIIPNEGDVFIADVGDGREGVFQVTTSTKKTIYRESAYEIEYKMLNYNTKKTADDLKDKVVETLYFSRDYLRQGYNALLHSEDLDNRDKLERHYARLLALYFHDFYSHEVGTLIVPNQEYYTYDPYITQFLANILSVNENPLLKEMRLLNVSEDQASYEFTLWNCLEQMDYQLLSMAAQEMAIVPTRYFFSRPMLDSVYYSKVGQVIYPKQHATTLDAGYREVRRPVFKPLVPGKARFEEFKRLIRVTDLTEDTSDGPYRHDGPEGAPHIHRVTDDDYYVFTEAFYNFNGELGNLSLLENLTLDALRGQALDLKLLEKICFGAKYWDNLERFYYTPVLLVLLRVYPRGL